MTANREAERQVTLTLTIPVYGIAEHVDKAVERIKRVIELSLGKRATVEVVEMHVDNPDQLQFDG